MHGMKADARSLRAYLNVRGWLALVVALTVLLLVLLNYFLQPRQVARLLLDRTGKALGLEIAATGKPEYGLRGTPVLILRDLVAREPGAGKPLLRAKRLYIALPWSTIRSRGDVLDATRIELDAPILDLPALQHWLATRPSSRKRLPTLTDGLQIRDGRILNDVASGHAWRIDGIDVDLPRLASDQPVHARLRGRYLDPPLAMPVDLAVAIEQPEALFRGRTTGFAIAGHASIQHQGDWTLPATVILSGPLTMGAGELQLTPARVGVAASFQASGHGAGNTRLPFSLGMHGPLRFKGATWTFAPATVVLHGRADDPDKDLVPSLAARGQLALGARLVVGLQGSIDGWPKAWPALPPPISQSESPLAFTLGYAGTTDLSQVATLRLRRDRSRFNGLFRLPDVTAWVGDGHATSPLPPLEGKLVTPELEIAGARLQGVEVIFDDPDVPSGASTDNAAHDRP